MNDRTDGVSRGWYDLGPYRILAMGLHLNHYFTTHRIHRDGLFVGAQLSVPTIDDCRWYEADNAYAKVSHWDSLYFPRQYAKRGRSKIMLQFSRPGRPTNAERARRDATLLTEIPE